MNSDIDEYITKQLEALPAFNKMFGKDGCLRISSSAIHQSLVDVDVQWEKNHGIPYDADELKEIGAALVQLGAKLERKN